MITSVRTRTVALLSVQAFAVLVPVVQTFAALAFAALASVLARIIKGTSAISAANLADFKLRTIVLVGTKTFPPI